MKKLIAISMLLVVFILSGCSETSTENHPVTGSRPPDVTVEIDGESYKTLLGSYCWNISKGKAECVDTVGPVELLQDKAPIQVQAGEKVIVNMAYTPKPNEVHLSQEKDGKETKVEVDHDQFTVPDEKGLYYYSYGVWWMDEEDENLSHGDAFYVFSIEVQ